MSSPDHPEPTNDELWSQPPTPGYPGSGSQAVAPHPRSAPPALVPHASAPGPQLRPDRTVFVLAMVSIALGIPLTAISSGTAGLPGMLVVWTGIVLVNLVYARSRRQ